MKQLSFNVNSITELASIKAELDVNEDFFKAHSVLLHIFSPCAQNDYLETLIQELKTCFPQIRFVGTTAGGMISNNQIEFENVELVFFLFENSEFQIKVYDFNKCTEIEIGNDLLHVFSNIKNIAGVEILTTLKTKKYISVLNFISDHVNLPIFGGGAWSVEFDGTIWPKIFDQDIYDDAIIVVIYYGEELYIKSDYCLGWIPLGKEMIVTGMDGDFCISEIDGKPAISIYEKYLKVIPDNHFFEHISIFPMAIVRENRLIARAPIDYDNQGRLYFNADIYIEDRIRLSYGNFTYILKDSVEMSKKYADFNAQAILLFSCGNRLNFFGENAKREVEIYSNASPDVSGYYSACEIVSSDNKINVLNSSLVVVGIREGEKGASHNKKKKDIQDKAFGEHIAYLESLLNFLEVTTEELEESNKKLEKLATTDGLTELLNRRGIEQILKYEMRKRSAIQKLAIIMCDVDYFKRINDKYGHDIGDSVLKNVGTLIKKCIRAQDSAGRWGGEEFMVILPDTELVSATQIAERIRKTIAETKFETVKAVTISAGVAIKSNEVLMEDVYKKADTALYSAKENGRNRVEVFL